MGVSSAYWTCFSQNSFMENCFSWADACFYHTIHQEVNDLEIPPTVPAKWITRKHNYPTVKSSLAFITLIVGRNYGLIYCFSTYSFTHHAFYPNCFPLEPVTEMAGQKVVATKWYMGCGPSLQGSHMWMVKVRGAQIRITKSYHLCLQTIFDIFFSFFNFFLERKTSFFNYT